MFRTIKLASYLDYMLCRHKQVTLEPTQVNHLKSIPYKGKLKALPTNIWFSDISEKRHLRELH